MRVLVIGATGGTGRELVAQALERGHIVTALARDPEKLAQRHEILSPGSAWKRDEAGRGRPPSQGAVA